METTLRGVIIINKSVRTRSPEARLIRNLNIIVVLAECSKIEEK